METKLSINDIAYCGINCRMCNLTTILPEAALKLYQIMKEDGLDALLTEQQELVDKGLTNQNLRDQSNS